MKPLFKEKVSKFGSLISLLAMAAMIVLFILGLTEFITSTTGRIFAAAWALLAITIFLAHSTRITGERRRRYIPYMLLDKKDVRTKKAVRLERVMRG